MRDRCSAQRRGDGGLSARLVVLVALGALIAAMLFAPPARALSAPEVYLQELDASDIPARGWVPLAGARMRSVNGYELGVRLQDTGQPGNRQRILVRVTSVPDGHPDQREIYSLCFSRSGAAGEVAKLDQRVRYEGDGAYSLAVTVSTGSDASANCAAGPTTTGSFTASAQTAVSFVGRLLFLDWREHHPFSGLRILPPPGSGGTDVRCARDPRRAPDGSLAGSRVVNKMAAGAAFSPVRVDAESLFRAVGRWACVARGAGGGVIPGPWSAPTATQVVQMGFYGPGGGDMRLLDPRGPTYLITQRLDPPTAGGILTVTFRQSASARACARGRGFAAGGSRRSASAFRAYAADSRRPGTSRASRSRARASSPRAGRSRTSRSSRRAGPAAGWTCISPRPAARGGADGGRLQRALKPTSRSRFAREGSCEGPRMPAPRAFGAGSNLIPQ